MKEHPERVDERLRDVVADTEVDLLAGDRVNVVYRSPREVIAIEVKSRVSDFTDLERGVFQCVKYRAVLAAQEQEEKSGRQVRAWLVTETSLPPDIDCKAQRLHVRHVPVPPVGRRRG